MRRPSLLQMVEHMRRINPTAVQIWESGTLDEFITAVERHIDAKVRRMESARAQYGQHDERGLSTALAHLLGECISAGAEEHMNGHADLVIRHDHGHPWVYIVECKIWRGWEWHQSGMGQVIRYATGRDRRVMVLAFFRDEKRMYFLLDRLRQDVEQGVEHPVIVTPPEPLTTPHPFIQGAFISRHWHTSQAVLEIAHVGCDLFSDGSTS